MAFTDTPGEASDPPRRGQQQNAGFAPWDDPAAVPLIEFEGVSKSYGDTLAVDDLSLAIYPREFFALLGPSGCGKTTLMRLLAGFETPSAGTIRLEGRDLGAVPPHQRPINMMFQSYALFPHLSVWDNIAFGLRRDKLPRPEIARRVDEMLTLVQLTAQGRRKPHQLSGGQRQRVALARSLAKRPRVLLLDEPLAALDKKLRGETQFELMNLQEEVGITFLIVTHDQEEAMVLADRIAIMREGRIEQIAPPRRLYESPASRYVADFVGDVNLIEGTVTASGPDGVRVAAEGIGATLVTAPCSEARAGSRGCVAVRPEKIAIAPAGGGGRVPAHNGGPVPAHNGNPPSGDKGGPPPADNALEGVIYDYAYLGEYTLFRVRTASGHLIEASRLNHRRADAHPLTWDDRVILSFEPADAVFLDR